MAADYSRQDTIDLVKSKLQALAENTSYEFLQTHKHIQRHLLLFQWLFSDRYSGFPSSAYDDANPIPKDIASWSDYDLDDCSSELSRNLISIRASLKRAVAPPTPTFPESRRDKKDYQVLRVRLKKLIESVIGREVFQRTGHPINYIKSDPDPPNGFQWVFSDEYPEFPNTALSDFRQDDVEACNRALDEAYLHVIKADSTTELSDRSDSVSNGPMSREAMIRAVREIVLKMIVDETGDHESVEDVPEILTQRSVIMDGLSWQLRAGYQFPFGGSELKSNKLQLTNWSNPELEDMLRALDNGDMKLIQDPGSSKDILLEERLPRRKDRPRRPRDSGVGVSSTSRRRTAATADTEDIITNQQNNDAPGKNIQDLLESFDDDQDLNLLRDLERVFSKRRTALQYAQNEITRLQDLIGSKDRQTEVKDEEIKTLKLRVDEANKRVTKAIALAQANQEIIRNGSDSERTVGGQKSCPICISNSSIIQDLQRRNSKNSDRVIESYERERKLEKQLKLKTDEIEIAKKRAFREGKEAGRAGSHRGSGHSDYSLAPFSIGPGVKDTDNTSSSSEDSSTGSEFDEMPTKRQRLAPPRHQDERKDVHSTNGYRPGISAQSTAVSPLPKVAGRTSLPSNASSKLGSNGHAGTASDYAPSKKFSPEFLRHLTGGTNQLFSSPKDGTTVDKQSIAWEKLIMINLACQPLAPKAPHESGSIYLVDGEPYCTNTCGVYPTVLSSDRNASFSYIGNCDVTNSTLVSIESWNALSPSVQEEFAEYVLGNAWGTKLLLEKNLLTEITSVDMEGKIKEVLGFFSRHTTPNLRMRSYSLRWAFFSKPDYKDLCSAWETFCTSDEQTRKRKREA